MALELSDLTRDILLDAIDTAIGTAGGLTIWSGGVPLTCMTANSGNKLVEIPLTNPAFQDSGGGVMLKSASAWTQPAATLGGTVGHFRIYDNLTETIGGAPGSRCILQGTCGAGAEDLVLDNAVVATGQTVTIDTFTLTAGNDDGT